MRHLLLTIIAVLFATASLAGEPEGSRSLPAAWDDPVLLQQFNEPETSSPRIQVASAREAMLIKGLELPASEFFVDEDAVEPGSDFELPLPEDVLPDSDIPLQLNSKVEYFVDYFQTRGRSTFARWLSRSERYIPMMKEVLRKEGLPEDLVYLAMIESGFSPHAYSIASAVGPWQFMSATGKRYSLRIDPWIDERRDPLKSTVAAALYLKELYDLFNKDWYLAAAGYNAGENKIMRAIGMYNSRDFWELTKGSYLKRETKDYVPKLLAAAIIAKEPAKYGFADVAYLPPIEFDTVTIPSQTDLELVARLIDVPYQALRDLNPELRRWCTPPEYPSYQLKLPLGKKESFEAQYAMVPADQRFTQKVVYARYRAKKRDTVASIARRFGTTPQAITEMNHLKKKSRIAGKTFIVPVPAAAGEKAPATPPVEGVKVAAAGNTKEFNKYYTIKKGDTLTALARKFNVSTKLLAAWNNLKSRVALRPGKRIIIAKYVEKNGAMASTADNG